MLRYDMGDFVSHDAGKFSLGFRASDEAARDIQKSTGERDGARVLAVDYLHGQRRIQTGISSGVPGKAGNVFRDPRVGQDFLMALHLLGHGPAESDLFLDWAHLSQSRDVREDSGCS